MPQYVPIEALIPLTAGPSRDKSIVPNWGIYDLPSLRLRVVER
jgi:hypothetical protein